MAHRWTRDSADRGRGIIRVSGGAALSRNSVIKVLLKDYKAALNWEVLAD